MQKSNFLLTGGHAAATATSLVQEIKERNLNCDLFWVGPRSAVEGKFVPTHASQIMPKLGVEFVPITTARLQRKFTIWTIPILFKIPIGILSGFFIIRKIKPSVVISFGGYASVPICFWAWIFRIPVIIHEQTVAAGRANKLTSFFAEKVLIARDESREYFPSGKTILVGNPVNSAAASIKPKSKISKKPTIYITVGTS